MKRKRWTALVLALAILLTGCGPAASSMHLRKTEGTVGVADEKGKTVQLREDLGLYSGYGVDTEDESFAWIDLDETKLTKMDENSEITIEKSGKHLTVHVVQGSFFFHVTEPLADDETMEIQASDLLVGIRGTCGWVERPEDGTARVYLLEGKVACETGEETATVYAGEMAELTPDGGLTIRDFVQDDVPAYILPEIADEPALLEDLPDAAPEEPPAGEPPEEEPPEETDPEPEPEPEPVNTGDTMTDAMMWYGYILRHVDEWLGEWRDGGTDTGERRYTLVQMAPDDPAPTLVIWRGIIQEGDARSVLYFFPYDADSGTVLDITQKLTIGPFSDPNGGFDTELYLAAGYEGLVCKDLMSSGEVICRDWRLEGGALIPALSDTDHSSGVEIGPWYSADDLSLLDTWTLPELPEPEPPEPPADGNRIVFAGTVHTYTHEEVLSLQGISGYFEPYSYYRLIILDEPMQMALTDRANGGFSTRTVEMICINWAEGSEQYEGHHGYFSVDSTTCWWPTDPTLPSEQPRTGDIHVLS